MHQIPATSLWLGNASDLRNVPTMLRLGITAIVDLAIEEPVPVIPRTVSYCRFAVTDDGENDPVLLMAAITLTALLAEGQHSTGICCSAGLSRSPVIAAAALSVVLRRPMCEMLTLVFQHRAADVSPAFLAQVNDQVSNAKQQAGAGREPSEETRVARPN